MKSKITPYTDKKGEEVTAKGLIEKDGDTVKLIYALPGGEMPTEFKTKEKQLMFVMKNENKTRGTTEKEADRRLAPSRKPRPAGFFRAQGDASVQCLGPRSPES